MAVDGDDSLQPPAVVLLCAGRCCARPSPISYVPTAVTLNPKPKNLSASTPACRRC